MTVTRSKFKCCPMYSTLPGCSCNTHVRLSGVEDTVSAQRLPATTSPSRRRLCWVDARVDQLFAVITVVCAIDSPPFSSASQFTVCLCVDRGTLPHIPDCSRLTSRSIFMTSSISIQTLVPIVA